MAIIPLAVLALVLVLAMPWLGGAFVAQTVAMIALYILMGLGLNITLGFAGLLDLGFVAFFAVGAYTVALLTSTGDFGLLGLPWWAAVPFGVLAAMVFGVFLGLPILGIRGDYLAIATLGFGEIISILIKSDVLKPWLGGPQGITNIPPPIPSQPADFLYGPTQIYYVALAIAAFIAFAAWRLRASRLGRAWIAIREDEDVAEALGVNLVQSKTLAYMLGAAFAGLGGAILVGLLGSVFPSTFNIVVSINVAAVVVVGGMGSIPGVIVGAIVLIGLPELFREFSEYRYLFYGVVLMFMMRFRPEGLLALPHRPARDARRRTHVGGPARGSEGGLSMALLEVTNATKRFGGLLAVNALDFTLDEGAIVSVIGPNGAGKTTFFNCIAGFYQIDEGSITLGGIPIHELRPDRIAHLGLSRTYQNIRLFGA